MLRFLRGEGLRGGPIFGNRLLGGSGQRRPDPRGVHGERGSPRQGRQRRRLVAGGGNRFGHVGSKGCRRGIDKSASEEICEADPRLERSIPNHPTAARRRRYERKRDLKTTRGGRRSRSLGVFLEKRNRVRPNTSVESAAARCRLAARGSRLAVQSGWAQVPRHLGGVAERLNAPVLKTGRPKGLVGSNPTPSTFAPDGRRAQPPPVGGENGGRIRTAGRAEASLQRAQTGGGASRSQSHPLYFRPRRAVASLSARRRRKWRADSNRRSSRSQSHPLCPRFGVPPLGGPPRPMHDRLKAELRTLRPRPNLRGSGLNERHLPPTGADSQSRPSARGLEFRL